MGKYTISLPSAPLWYTGTATGSATGTVNGPATGTANGTVTGPVTATGTVTSTGNGTGTGKLGENIASVFLFHHQCIAMWYSVPGTVLMEERLMNRE